MVNSRVVRSLCTIMQKLNFFVLSLILIGAFVVRLYKIESPLADWHAWRQVDTASVSKNLIASNYDLLHPRYHDISSIQTGSFNPKGYRFVEFPIFNLLHALFSQSIPQISFETAGRLVSIFSAVITTLALYLIGSAVISSWGGLLAAFFYAFIPYNIYFTRVILPDPLSTCLGTVSIGLFLFYINKNNKLSLFASGIAFALAMLVKPFAIFYAVPIFYLAAKKFTLKKLIQNIPLLIALDIALIPFLLWRIWLNKPEFLVGIAHMSWALNGDHIRFKPSFFKWIFKERLGTLILGTWGIFPFAVGIISAKSQKMFINFFLLGSLLYVTIIATANVRHDYYQTFIIPSVALALAQGSVFIWNSQIFNKFLARGLLIFSILIMLLIGIYETKGNYNINHPELMKAGKAADSVLPQDALVIAPYNGDTTFLYQTGRSGWPVVNESIEGMINKGADYYISVNYDSDTNNFMTKFKALEKNNDYVILDLHQKLNP